MLAGGELREVVVPRRSAVEDERALSGERARVEGAPGALRGHHAAHGDELGAHVWDEMGRPPVDGVDDVRGEDATTRGLHGVEPAGICCNFGARGAGEYAETARAGMSYRRSR